MVSVRAIRPNANVVIRNSNIELEAFAERFRERTEKRLNELAEARRKSAEKANTRFYR